VPKQSSRGNKAFLRNIITYTLLCYSDRCTRALTRCSADEGTKFKGRERSPLATTPRLPSATLRPKGNDGVLKVAVTNCGEPIWPSRTPKPLDQSEWEGRIEAEGYRQLPQMRHRALELMQ
jgi:hypothetical protein